MKNQMRKSRKKVNKMKTDFEKQYLSRTDLEDDITALETIMVSQFIVIIALMFF